MGALTKGRDAARACGDLPAFTRGLTLAEWVAASDAPTTRWRDTVEDTTQSTRR